MRSLWFSVIIQALKDIAEEPIGSRDFQEAVWFFTRNGSWAESRSAISDFLDMHADELQVMGQRCINLRLMGKEVRFAYAPRGKTADVATA